MRKPLTPPRAAALLFGGGAPGGYAAAVFRSIFPGGNNALKSLAALHARIEKLKTVFTGLNKTALQLNAMRKPVTPPPPSAALFPAVTMHRKIWRHCMRASKNPKPI